MKIENPNLAIDPSQFVTVSQAAEAFGIAPNTIRNSIRLGKPILPGHTKLPNGRIAFFKDDLRQYAKQKGWKLLGDSHEKK